MQEKKLRQSESFDFSFKIEITNDSTFKIKLNSVLYNAFRTISLSRNFSDLIEVCNKETFDFLKEQTHIHWMVEIYFYETKEEDETLYKAHLNIVKILHTHTGNIILYRELDRLFIAPPKKAMDKFLELKT